MATVASSQPSSASDFINSLGSSSSSKTKASSATDDMQDRFLTLLTTQIKNQDPLNPLDNAQVTSQLAQINTVNGIEKLNASISKLLNSYGDSQAMQAADMIGKSVLVAGSELDLQGGLGIGGLKLDTPADSVIVKIFDAAGHQVDAQNLGARAAGTFSFGWDGKLENGTTAPSGAYHVTVEATQGSTKLKPTVLQLGTVNAVTRGSNGFVLDLGAAGAVPFDQVAQIL